MRYIDDILIICRAALCSIPACLNDFDGSIHVTHDDAESGESSSFLDLYINASDSSNIVYETYRKPMCTYDYLPYNSCHSKACKHGIFKGEVKRLLRTNSRRESFEREVNFTFQKLIDRGYNREVLRSIRDACPWSSKHSQNEGKQHFVVKRVLPFKIRYSDAVHKIGIG